ncbi:MAG: F0F1 ATP synthase subunit B [Tangfeifania sp.]
MELVTPNVGTIFWMVIIFGVVAFVLGKFAWKPILNALNEREKNIDNALQAAEQARKEMKSLKADNEKIMAEAKKDKEKILHEALELKDKIIAEAKQKADANAESSIRHAKHQIQNEKAKAINELKQQMTELSLMIAEKVIRKELDTEGKQQEMIKKLVDGIKLN